jgi:hypothetical protein
MILGVVIILLATLLSHDSESVGFPKSIYSDEFGVWRISDKDKVAISGENPKKIAILVHTFDGYRRYWKPWIYFFNKHYSEPEWHIYFANEVKNVQHLFPEKQKQKYHHIPCGSGSWGHRLIVALNHIDAEYVLYMQEDMWLNRTLLQTYLNDCLSVCVKKNVKQLKLQAGCFHQRWSVYAEGHPSWYIISHQPGIWNREYLLSTLQPNMSPYDHEIQTNIKLHKQPELSRDIYCGAMEGLRPFPYVGVSQMGVLTYTGESMLKRAGISYVVESDEVGYKPRQNTK